MMRQYWDYFKKRFEESAEELPDLEPCPFCGNPACYIKTRHDLPDFDRGGHYIIACRQKCAWQIDHDIRAEEAAEKWNKRA